MKYDLLPVWAGSVGHGFAGFRKFKSLHAYLASVSHKHEQNITVAGGLWPRVTVSVNI